LVAGGLLIIGGAYTIHHALDKRVFPSMLPLLIALAGIGSVGVGVFNETFGIVHWLLSALTFIAGGFAAIAASATKRHPSVISR
jgi:hypothetical membrane protein